MAELPISFTAENRLAVWRDVDPKTHTRRVIVPQPTWFVHEDIGGHVEWGKYQFDDYFDLVPYARYQVGDELWMQEPYQIENTCFDSGGRLKRITYLDDGRITEKYMPIKELEKWAKRKFPFRTTSARFMYRSLARKWVLVKRVWVERVQDISRADAVAEGIIHEVCHHGHKSVCTAGCRPEPEYKFRDLWNSINAKPRPSIINGIIIGYMSYPWDDTGEYAKLKTYRGKPHICYPNPYIFGYELEKIVK